MQVKLKRVSAVQTVAVGTDTASSTSARCDHMAGAAIVVRNLTASATFTVWGSSNDSTFAALAAADGSAATMTIPSDGSAVAVPDAVFAVPFIRFVSDSVLSTAASVSVVFKS
jgi:hypothetical protein